MKHPAILTITLSAFLISLIGFTQPITAGGSVSGLVHQYCSANKHFPHFNAAAGTGSWQGGVRSGGGWSVGCAAGQPSIKSAIYLAMSRCKSAKKTYDAPGLCKLYFLGDVDVSAMNPAEVKKVGVRYEEARRLANSLNRQGLAKHPFVVAKKDQVEDRPTSHQRSSVEGQ